MRKSSRKIDNQLLLLSMGLLVCGLMVLFSASTVESLEDYGNTYRYFLHQLFFGGLIGLIAMYVGFRLDYHIWQKFAPLAVGVSLILLLLVKVPGLSLQVGGASRWIHLGFITFQPSEIAKLALIFYLASWFTKKGHQISDFYYGVLPTLIIIGLFALLILWQPDLGTMLVMTSTALVMLFVSGVTWKHFLSIIGAGLVFLGVVIKLEPYRMERLVTFMNRSHDTLGISYQINQALIAIGSGGVFGYGYGLSRQKHNYLPEPIGDSIFAIMAEELGLIRVSLVILLFVLFILKGFKVAASAPDFFGKMLAAGIVIGIMTQALINIGAIIGILPLTGVPLPFFSYGSTSLVITLAGCGILLNISSQSKA